MNPLLSAPRPWVIGMVHLQALPGTPFGSSTLPAVVEQAVADAAALAAGGATAVLVQNRGDRAFPAAVSSPEVVAAVGAATFAVVQAVEIPVGVHLLRNDTRGSLGVARAAGACFVRSAVLTGSSDSAQGPLVGNPEQVLRYRAEVGGSDIALLADVASMHNRRELADVASAAADAVFFGDAAAVSVSDPDTDRALALALAATAAGVPVLIGGHATVDNAVRLLAAADGVIVGSAVERGERSGGVDPDLVAAFVAACR